MSLQDYEERLAKKNATKRQKAETRKASRRKYEPETRRLMSQVRRLVSECGLTQTQISLFSGLVKSAITRLLKTQHSSARIGSIVQILGAAGYKLEIVPIDPHRDEYREFRRFKPPPLED